MISTKDIPISWKLRIGILLLAVFVWSGGMQVQAWLDSGERTTLIAAFPRVRAEERASCKREYDAQIEGIRKLNAERDAREAAQTGQLKQQGKLLENTLNLIADVRTFMGTRAKVSDAALATARRNLQKTDQLQQTVKVAEQKATVAAAKADETASAVRSVDKKLDTAVRPTLPFSPRYPGGH